ncbi:MAG: Mut7-C ubiquitin/RNAse domain-containing protein [Anaerolineales bacterium]|nr:Mut7-C ubiquitin/RNAse domain-containing protein [Anaerolineales bacterium]
MRQAQFRFYSELNDFLPAGSRSVTVSYLFMGTPAIKDSLEALGVPHTEVDLVLVNGESVDFRYLLQDGDRASVFPEFRSIDITPILKVRPEPLQEMQFVLDIHLGRLTSYLRMMGFDSLYRNDYADNELACVAHIEGRILLTRDRGLLKRSEVTHGYYLRASQPYEQLIEVMRRFNLTRLAAPFKRCIRCNGMLEDVSKEMVKDHLPPKVKERHVQFRHCRSCGQVYWQGSHYERMCRLIAQVFEEANGS